MQHFPFSEIAGSPYDMGRDQGERLREALPTFGDTYMVRLHIRSSSAAFSLTFAGDPSHAPCRSRA